MKKIFGMGQFTQFDLYCKYSGISLNKKNLSRVKKGKGSFETFINLPSSYSQKIIEETNNIFKLLNDNFLGYYLRRHLKRQLFVLRKSRCWRGLRHEQHLPVRGQRSKTNAKTRKRRLA